MNFIRENMVLTIIAGVVVVFGGGLLVMGRSLGGDVDELIEQRDDLSRGLRRHAGGERISPEKLDAKRAAVERLQEQAEAVVEETIQWNRRDYEVLHLSAGDEEVPAFPINSDLYRQYSLRYKFMMAYNDALGALVEPMRVTRPPTEQEIESRAVVWERHLQERPEDEQTDRPTEGTGDWDRRFPEDMGLERIRRQPTRTGDPDIAVSDEARTLAMRDVTRQQAQEGLIYIQPDVALHNMMPEHATSRAALTNELLWQAQVNLWVQQDILRAIHETNVAAVREAGGDPDQAGVFDSAVKRLVSIEVRPEYYLGEGQQTGTDMVGEEYRGRTPARQTPARAQPRQGETLTGRVTNQMHEIVHYQFTVVMRPDQSVRLMEKLMSRNCHAVLERHMTRVGETDQQSGRTTGAGMYDYGPAPVRQVTFRGELLLMVPLTRGRWDEQEQQWSQEYPPLTPVEVLRHMPWALRDVDERRVREGTPGSGGVAAR